MCYGRSYITDALSQPPISFPFTAVPGVNTGLPRNASPLQYLELFLTFGVWRYILQTTNDYAAARLRSEPPRRRSVFLNWTAITLTEMKAFVGVIIQMGLVQLSDIKDYWSTHITLNVPFFRSVFFLRQIPPDILDAACGRNSKSNQTI